MDKTQPAQHWIEAVVAWNSSDRVQVLVTAYSHPRIAQSAENRQNAAEILWDLWDRGEPPHGIPNPYRAKVTAFIIPMTQDNEPLSFGLMDNLELRSAGVNPYYWASDGGAKTIGNPLAAGRVLHQIAAATPDSVIAVTPNDSSGDTIAALALHIAHLWAANEQKNPSGQPLKWPGKETWSKPKDAEPAAFDALDLASTISKAATQTLKALRYGPERQHSPVSPEDSAEMEAWIMLIAKIGTYRLKQETAAAHGPKE